MTRAVWALAVFVLALAASAAAAAGCDDCVMAGAARVPLTIAPGASVAGYGSFARRPLIPNLFDGGRHAFWFRSNTGVRDALRARALVLESGHTRIVWISLDLVAVDRAFTGRVAARLAEIGVPAGTVIVSASHTHSGPGGFMDAGIFGPVAVDRLDRALRELLVDSAVDAVRRADAAKTRARVAVASVAIPELTTGRLGAPVDAEAVVMKIATPTGTPVALVWNYAIHGTMLGPRNLGLSGDVAGTASDAVEARVGAPVLFVNGAVGDVSPAGHGDAAMRATAAQIADAVQSASTRAVAIHGNHIAVLSAHVELPRARLSLHNCLGRFVPRALTLPLGLAHDAELVAARVGDVAWVTVPGELQSALAVRLKETTRAAGLRAFVAGLSNDYLGYFLTAADYDRVTYVSCASLYGRDGGERLARAAADVLGLLARREGR